MRLIFFGTSSFAVPILQALLDHYSHEIVALVTKPDEPVGRKGILTPPPVKQLLEVRLPNMEVSLRHIQILQPEKLKEIIPRLQELKPDMIVLASYGKIIPQSILDIPRLGCINVHPSLLPRHRGASPIQTTILHGDTETGVSIMKMDKDVDHGPLLAQTKIQIQKTPSPYEGEGRVRLPTYQELQKELSELGAKLLIDTLPRYIAGEIRPQEQDHSKATFTKIFTKEDGHIDWTKSAEHIERMVRALNPWPGTYTKVQSSKFKVQTKSQLPNYPITQLQTLKILKTKILHSTIGCAQDPRPGVLWLTESSELARQNFAEQNLGGLTVNANPGSLILDEVQPEGKKPMSGVAFLNGHKELLGTILQ